MKLSGIGIKLALAALIVVSSMVSASAKEKVRIALIASDKSGYGYQVRHFIEGVEKKLPGQFKFTVYPDAQLGKPDAIMNNIRLGSLEMAILSSTVIRLDKKLGLFDLPWLFDGRDHVKRSMMGPLGDEILSFIEKKGGIKALAIYETGFRQVMNKKHPIVTPADLKGMKIRISGGKFRRKVFSALGANPVPVVWNELYTAAQTGVVDGAEAAIFYLHDANLNEVMSYLSFTNHVYSPAFLVASNAFFGKLNDEQRTVFREVALSVREGAYAWADVSDKEIVDKMVNKTKVKTNKIDFPAFSKSIEPVYKEYRDAFGSAWLNAVEKSR